MKKLLQLIFLLIPVLLIAQVTTNPSTIEIDQEVTITIDANSSDTDCNGFSNPSKIYAHLGVGDDNDEYGISVVGNWGQDDGVGEMTDLGAGLWSITFTPNTYFGLSAAQESNVTKMGMVFRNEDGSQEFKDNGCTNFIFNVGSLQVTMINPDSSGTILVESGGQTQIIAQSSVPDTNFELFINGTSFHTTTTQFYQSPLITNITENKYCELVVTKDASNITKSFVILVNGTVSQSIPSGMENGINYGTDNTSATLVLDAPNKDFVYVAGSFNSWAPTSVHAMKQDSATGKFWLELTGLTSGQIETYQYWVADQSPITDSPELVKTADPFSTLVLSPFDDPWIPAASYPNIPAYPSGQEREVTVLQTGQTAYNWQVTNFAKPNKEDLIIYEVLIRDFDADRNFQDLIDKIDYFKNLNINAIQLMPIMEYEGNESWGYNTAFHMALDKFYGTEDKFREFVDLCHQNGIAVILDVALNHAFGRNPMNRMWMDDPDGDGWGDPSSENPYFNQVAAHSYSVGSDFNHQSTYTQYYVERVIKHWIEEFKIDGFRWDLTKGFTQNCTNNEGCTNDYNSDRVAILKQYADYSWGLDPDHYVIFEHLGVDWDANTDGQTSLDEETEWANYKVGEGKGIMLWGKMTDPYNELTMGQTGNKNINGMGHEARGFSEPRLVGYAESHDEERLMFKNVTYGVTGVGGNLNASLGRMSALGAVSLTIPGPKMIWHFGELGMDNSIFTCNDGSYNNDGCKLDTKPQPQWTENWLVDTFRSPIYNDWSRLIELKINEAVFEGNYSIDSGDLTPRIFIWDDALPVDQLKNVVILANFETSAQDIVPNFPYTGTWYDLMDDTGSTTINVNDTAGIINIPAGEFRIYGNETSTLSIDEFDIVSGLSIYPNPSRNTFSVNADITTLKIYDVTGKLIKEFKGDFPSGIGFDISNLNQGLYLIKLENHLGQSNSAKLIKQ